MLQRVLALFALLAGFAGSAARAQTVRGIVTRAGAPIPGVVVQLLDSTDAPSGASISDERGVYRIIAPRAGTFRVLARRIGFAPHRTPPFVLATGIVRDVPIELSSLAVVLDTIRIRAATCVALSRTDSPVAAVWEQTKTALLATDATTSSRPLSTLLMRYQRIDRAGTVTVRTVDVQDADSGSAPWYAPSPRVMRDKGYARWLTPTTMQFWAPSLEVLGSSEFSAEHCARLDDASDPSLVVLAFEPRRKRREIIDITGRIAVDRHTAELRELSFRYTNVDSAAVNASAGGRMQFARARDGSWLVTEWFIRVPVVDSSPRRPDREARAIVYAEQVGGRVFNARRGDDTVFVQPFPTLSGVLRDSVTARPVPNAQLLLRESWRVAVTDSVGAFTIGAVRPGVHTLQINTSSLDSLGVASVKRLLVADSLSASRLTVPSLRQALAGMCVREATFPTSGVPSLIHGVVTARATDSLERETAKVNTTSASDSQPTFVRAVWMDPYTGMPMRFSTPAEPSGQYRLCGLPPDIPLDLYAERGARTSTPVRVQLNGTSPYGVQHHDVQPRSASEGALRGVVRDGQQRLVSGALVSIDSLLRRSVTEISGAWRMPRVSAGRVVLSVRRVGFAPLDTAITLAAGADSTLNLVLTALPRLGAAPRSTDGRAANSSVADDSAAAVVQWAAFEARRKGPGQFMLRDRLERAEGKPLGDLLRTLRDAAITPAIALSGAVPSGDVSSAVLQGAVLQGAVLRSGAITFRCPSAVFLDSRPLYFGLGDPIDLNLFAPEQFESLEWYANDREIPPVFRGLATCGLLVLHARR